MKVFIVGIAGGVGGKVADRLLTRRHEVDGLVRDSSKVDELARRGIASRVGDLVKMSTEELGQALHGSDAIVFSAGAGGKDGPEATTQVDGEGPGKMAAAAEIAGIRRLILVSVFPEAWRERHMPKDFEHYMVEKKKAETTLVLADLDWVILRPAALTNDPGAGTVDLGLAKIHVEISRDDVAETIVGLLEHPHVSQRILEVTRGLTPISDAIEALEDSADDTKP